MMGGGFLFALSLVWCSLFHRKHHELNTLLYGDQRLEGLRVCTKCSALKGRNHLATVAQVQKSAGHLSGDIGSTPIGGSNANCTAPRCLHPEDCAHAEFCLHSIATNA